MASATTVQPKIRRSISMIKKTAFIIPFILFPLFSCGTPKDNGKLKILCTIFPEYEWMKAITNKSNKVEVDLLLDKGSDIHSFNPSVNDMMKVATADLFVYVGGESDTWVDSALKNVTNKNQKTINLHTLLEDKLKPEESKEGMQEEEEEEEEETFDEHVWLSLSNASFCVNAFKDILMEMVSEEKDLFINNAKEYIDDLTFLDFSYKEMVESSTRNTILVADRFPFRYLVDDYGIDYFAAFKGCSSDIEATPETIAFLINKVDELALSYILVTESSDKRLANTVKSESKIKNQEILVLDSMQGTTLSEGKHYLSIMENNLEVLRKALNDVSTPC